MTEDKNPMKRQVKVYVAGSSHPDEHERVHRVFNLVKEHAYLQLTYDWLKVIERVGASAPTNISQEQRVAYAMEDLEAVHTSDIFWYLQPDGPPSMGASFEFGAAWGLASQWTLQGNYMGAAQASSIPSRVLIASGVDPDAQHIFCALADYQWDNDGAAWAWLVGRATLLIEGE